MRDGTLDGASSFLQFTKFADAFLAPPPGDGEPLSLRRARPDIAALKASVRLSGGTHSCTSPCSPSATESPPRL